MRSVNRVGEIYVGERETKGNQSFRKMFALQTTSTSQTSVKDVEQKAQTWAVSAKNCPEIVQML